MLFSAVLRTFPSIRIFEFRNMGQGTAMKLLEDVLLTDSVAVNASPDAVFAFLRGLKDDESYRAWHPGDHLSLRWMAGDPWDEGSVVHAEEYLHGKLHKVKFQSHRQIPANTELQVQLICVFQ